MPYTNPGIYSAGCVNWDQATVDDLNRMSTATGDLHKAMCEGLLSENLVSDYRNNNAEKVSAWTSAFTLNNAGAFQNFSTITFSNADLSAMIDVSGGSAKRPSDNTAIVRIDEYAATDNTTGSQTADGVITTRSTVNSCPGFFRQHAVTSETVAGAGADRSSDGMRPILEIPLDAAGGFSVTHEIYSNAGLAQVENKSSIVVVRILGFKHTASGCYSAAPLCSF